MIKAGLDIGNSKISCVIADYKNTENINILSINSVPNNNIKKNIILNFENLHDQIKSLVIEAEKQSQTKLNSINLNLSLLNSNSHYYDSAIELKNERISELHLKKIINQSEYFNNLNEKFEIFNNITSYDIDNTLYFNAPIGNYSDNIKINFYKILIKKKYSDNISSTIKKSTPSKLALIILLTALPPEPPTPKTVILGCKFSATSCIEILIVIVSLRRFK